jgi:DNA invertase Pin-like site-specific DNA recombinase
MILRCAAYARYSSDLQSPLSIDDQLRICREYAKSRGFVFLEEHVYVDEALSGVGADRPGLGRLLNAALSPARPFDVILLDDSSRLARNTKDALTFFERLNFAGIRLIAVSQGIDSDNEQAHVLVTVHGMVDSLYVKELAKKTHRGLEGRVLRGQHTGGRCYGYDSVSVDATTAKQLVINESEAVVVRRIFEMSANGQSLKTIAKTLNRECVPSPRPRSGNQYATWSPTCIREMLRRDLYVGKVVWNASRFVKVPGTNKRVRRARPESEWRIVPHPELQIVSDEVWTRVQDRQKRLMAMYSGAKKGLLPRSVTSPYLLSGILKCGLCRGNLIIVTGYSSYGHYPQYGCSQHFNRGACTNSVLIRRDWLEKRLLEELQNEVLKSESVEYALDEFGSHLKNAFAKLTSQMAHMRERKQKLEGELRRLAATAAETGPSSFLVAAIHEREQQLREITDQLLAGGDDSVDAHLSEIRSFIAKRLGDLQGLISGESAEARKELLKHVSEIRMFPQGSADGNRKPHYVAEGTWNLVGTEEDQAEAIPAQVRSVADPRNHLEQVRRVNQPVRARRIGSETELRWWLRFCFCGGRGNGSCAGNGSKQPEKGIRDGQANTRSKTERAACSNSSAISQDAISQRSVRTQFFTDLSGSRRGPYGCCWLRRREQRSARDGSPPGRQ